MARSTTDADARLRTGSLVLAVSLTVAALTAFFWPGNQLPGWHVLSWDKLLHAGLFLVLTIAWLRTGLTARGVLLLMFGLIVVSEVGQSALPIGRYGDPFDALADLVGVLVALGWWGWLDGRRSIAKGPAG